MTTPSPIKIGAFDIQHGPVEPLGRTYLFYGPFGTAKTHTAATVMALGKCLWVITDANTDSILLKFPSKNVDRIYITRYIEKTLKIRDPENPKAFKEIDIRAVNPNAYMNFCDVMDDLWTHDAYDYDFVIVDSMTTIGDMCMDMVLIKNGFKPIDDAPQIQHFGEQIRQLLAKCGYGIQDMAKATKTNVIIICHDKVIEDKKLGTIGIFPALTGQAGRTIGKEYEEVYHFSSVLRSTPVPGGDPRSKSEFQARTRGTAMIAAKTQIDDLPDIIPHANLNMTYIIGVRDRFIEKMEERARKEVEELGKTLKGGE